MTDTDRFRDDLLLTPYIESDPVSKFFENLHDIFATTV